MKCKILYPAGDFTGKLVSFDFPITDFIPNGVYKSEDLLEIIYRQCNHVDGTEWISNKKLRSMSCGDLVVIQFDDDQTVIWNCAGCGWERVII